MRAPRSGLLLLPTVCAIVVVPALGRAADVKAIAREFLEESRAWEPWGEVRLRDPPSPLYRPDLPGVAYVEYAVMNVRGEPAGSVLLATERHDHPVVAWSAAGGPLVEQFRAELRLAAGARIYWIDFLSFVAEDATGTPLADSRAARPMSRAEWAKLKRSYAGERRAQLAALRADAASEWAYWLIPTAKRRGACEPWERRAAGTQVDQPTYGQIDAGVEPNTSGCPSGCGATAWSILFGWHDQQALKIRQPWRQDPCGALFQGQLEAAPIDVTETEVSTAVKEMIWEVRNDVDTFCLTGNIGSTWPQLMGNAREYVRRRIPGPDWTLTSRYNGAFGVNSNVPTDARRDEADAVIRSGRPVIIQLGWEHFAVAFAFEKQRCAGMRDRHRFHINDGHWGDFRWTHASTSYVGHLECRVQVGTLWQACPPAPQTCQAGLACYQGFCRRPPAEGEPCFTSGGAACAAPLVCQAGACVRPPWAGKCTECVPGSSGCNVSGCPVGHECSSGPAPRCLGGTAVNPP